ncbi:MAG: glycosyltransferase, partial [Deltaproteobacteria bacterium]|nr:glycosyltransferase [Deltaproteobacteria bacterium]
AHGCVTTQVVSNGVSGPISPSPLPSGPLVLGWFGVPSPTKGLDVLLEAMGHLSPEICTLELHGVEEGAIPELPRHVVIKGRYAPENVGERMAGVHAVVVPSTWPENQPMVVLEAHAAGRPVIASHIGGLPELVRDEVDGWLVPAGEPAALGALLMRLARNVELVHTAARAVTAPAHVAALSRAHATIYSELLGPTLPAFDPGSAGPPQ